MALFQNLFSHDLRKTDVKQISVEGPTQPNRGCNLGAYQISKCSKGRKSVILKVWGAPGAPETPQKCRGDALPPSEMATEVPGAAQTPKMTDFRPLENSEFPPKVQPQNGDQKGIWPLFSGATRWPVGLILGATGTAQRAPSVSVVL